ncbi:hypothetical protein [Paraburkholderia terricola]|uniref:hypothetical protein n=1 Tax=Paraburkholderia terricola TaxID=169427 RepID=UPI001ABF748D|nr:hypothetical protein [Paraburkholderia terricola]
MKSTFAVLGLLALTGCASIIDGSTQVISVETRRGTELVSGANCQLTNNKGTWFVTTPGTVAMHRSYDDLNIKCERAASEPGVTTVKSSTRGMAFGNILFGGVVGAAIDMGSGAAYDYPALITVMMGAAKIATPSVVPAPAIASQATNTAWVSPGNVVQSCSTLPPGQRVNCTIP